MSWESVTSAGIILLKYFFLFNLFAFQSEKGEFLNRDTAHHRHTYWKLLFRILSLKIGKTEIEIAVSCCFVVFLSSFYLRSFFFLSWVTPHLPIIRLFFWCLTDRSILFLLFRFCFVFAGFRVPLWKWKFIFIVQSSWKWKKESIFIVRKNKILINFHSFSYYFLY